MKMATGYSTFADHDFVPDFVCDLCMLDNQDKHVEAIGWCINCEDYLCNDCFRHHLKPKPSRKHVLLGKQQMPKQRTTPTVTKGDSNQVRSQATSQTNTTSQDAKPTGRQGSSGVVPNIDTHAPVTVHQRLRSRRIGDEHSFSSERSNSSVNVGVSTSTTQGTRHTSRQDIPFFPPRYIDVWADPTLSKRIQGEQTFRQTDKQGASDVDFRRDASANPTLSKSRRPQSEHTLKRTDRQDKSDLNPTRDASANPILSKRIQGEQTLKRSDRQGTSDVDFRSDASANPTLSKSRRPQSEHTLKRTDRQGASDVDFRRDVSANPTLSKRTQGEQTLKRTGRQDASDVDTRGDAPDGSAKPTLSKRTQGEQTLKRTGRQDASDVDARGDVPDGSAEPTLSKRTQGEQTLKRTGRQDASDVDARGDGSSEQTLSKRTQGEHSLSIGRSNSSVNVGVTAFTTQRTSRTDVPVVASRRDVSAVPVSSYEQRDERTVETGRFYTEPSPFRFRVLYRNTPAYLPQWLDQEVGDPFTGWVKQKDYKQWQ